MKYLSLFTGIGGFELGIQNAYEQNTTDEHERPSVRKGHIRDTEGRGERELPTCIGYSEIDKYACSIYQRHFPDHYNHGDITLINEKELPDFDLLVGGFPCQSFSIAGKRGGFNDTRGTLFFDIARIIREKQPRLLLLENVKGLLSHDNGATFRTIIATLDELGYDCQWQVLNSKNHGVPQNRERVFIVGNSRGTRRPEVFPFGDTDTKSIKSKNNAGVQRQPHRRENITDLNGMLKYFREASGGYQQQKPPRLRRLTPTECERLQGFKDGWTEGVSDTQRYKTLGNAVTTNVIEAIISRML